VEPEYIFLTAFSTNAFRKYLKAQKVDHCYEKPINGDLLRDLLDNFVFSEMQATTKLTDESTEFRLQDSYRKLVQDEWTALYNTFFHISFSIIQILSLI